MKQAFEQVFNGSLTQLAFDAAYDATKINRGKHTGQFNLGSGENDKFIGPAPVGVANFGESTLAQVSNAIHPVKISEDLYWIFANSAATAAATRPIQLWTFVPSTNTYTLVGAINCTYPTATNHTSRGLRAVLENYSTGTVEVSGTTVTGVGSAWNTGLSVGSRIGFGSTNPNNITTWYQIAAINSDTSITLTSSAGTIAAGTSYVIQDLMILMANTNATVTNGGLFVAKGLRYEDFTQPATTIPAAVSTDKVKAVYWLKDAATITNDVIGGCALADRLSWTQQYTYCTEGAATSLQIYRYNFRAPLTVSSGAAVLSGSNMVVTGAQTVTGNISQANNGRIATLTHGPGANVESLYMFTASRILRIPTANVVGGSTTFVADSMLEVSPGGANTNSTSGSTAFVTFDVSQAIDKLVIGVVGGTTSSIYVTDYYTSGQQFDRRAGCGTGQLPSTNRDYDSPIFIHNVYAAAAMSPALWVEDGWMFYLYTQSTTANVNALSAYPLAADMLYTAEVNNRVICPKISLGAVPAKFYRAVVNSVQNLGSIALGVAPDMYELQYRTSGIDDNSGAWTTLPSSGDLSGVSSSANIQFAFRFRTAGVIMLPARVLSLALIYESADALPSQYRWNFSDFSTANGTFAWVQSALFSASLTTHTIEIYRADTDALVLTQASTSTTNGTFEYWNGSAWVAGLGSDVVGTRRRFVPSGSLPGSVDLYAKILV